MMLNRIKEDQYNIVKWFCEYKNYTLLFKRFGLLLISFPRYLLYKIFHFEKWHLRLGSRVKYRLDVIKYLNKRKEKHSVCEIGCGLGDMLLHLNFKKRKGYDNSIEVIRAAKVLSKIRLKKATTFEHFDFLENDIQGEFNAILLINWIHNIEPNLLKLKLEKYFAKNLQMYGEIIIDTVQNEAYKYNHDIKFLTKGLDMSLFRIGNYENEREVWAIKKGETRN